MKVLRKSRNKVRKLLKPIRYHKGPAAIIGIILAIGTYFSFAQAATIVNQDTMQLSNGKEIHLGQSVQSLVDTIGADLYKTDDQHYSYPADVRYPAEVMIFVKGGKIVALQADGYDGNVHKDTLTSVGQSQDQVATRVGGRLKNLDSFFRAANLKGSQINQVDSDSIFLSSSCNDSDQIQSVALVLKGYENVLVDANGLTDCTQTD